MDGESPSSKRPRVDFEEDDLSETNERKMELLDQYYMERLNRLATRHEGDIGELRLLQTGGNMLELPLWLRERAPNDPHLVAHLSMQRSRLRFQLFLPPTLETRLSNHLRWPPSQPTSEAELDGANTSRKVKSESVGTDAAASKPESIVDRVRHERTVMQRIAELRRQGLWSARRLPKCHEPARVKSHWDYVLDEMEWMANDFAQERKWKLAACRRIAAGIQKYHRDQELRESQTLKEESLRLRRVASQMARMVRDFWSGLQRVLQHRQSTLLEEKRKQLLSMQLDFLVGQSEQFSSWLVEGLTSTSGQRSGSHHPASIQLSEKGKRAPSTGGRSDQSDQEFVADEDMSSVDDETTIARAEVEEGKSAKDELAELEADVDLPIESLLEQYQQAFEATKEMQLSEHSSSERSSAPSSVSSDDESETTEEPKAPEPIDSSATTSAHPQNQATEKQQITAHEELSRVETLAAEAESVQPHGYTLAESEQLQVAVPSLIRGTLREYQLVGLGWLATMYERHLNGILADEMGLGKTIQTIALLAYLACERQVWGPHLIIVPTSVLLNWEMEFKKWCPGFKILTYFGSPKERRAKRQGWTKTNAFHVCITSYKLAIQDHTIFRRKKWKYLVLDEAQHIKNFKSQRWQLLLTLQSQRRLLLTGTPLQNSLMELWSLMHFLMPHLFRSHSEFREWFANPLSEMIEGEQEYQMSLVQRLHKVLRPFLLRRLKRDVEKQMPKKFEHIVSCPLSRRQRFLYDDFMSRGATKSTLTSGSFMGVMNVLMQLRKVCNHPNLFEPRPVTSPLQLDSIVYTTSSNIFNIIEDSPHEIAKKLSLFPNLAAMEFVWTQWDVNRVRNLCPSSEKLQDIILLEDKRVPPPEPANSKPMFPLVPADTLIMQDLYRLSEQGLVDFELPLSFLSSSNQPPLQSDSNILSDANNTSNTETLPSNKVVAPAIQFAKAFLDKAYKNALGPMQRRDTARQSCIEFVTRLNSHRCFSVNSDVPLPLYGMDLRKAVSILDLHSLINFPFFVEVDGRVVGQGYEDLVLALNKVREPEASAIGKTVTAVEKPSCTMRHSIGFVHCSHAEHLQDLSSHSICPCAGRSISLALVAQSAALSEIVRPGFLRLPSMEPVLERYHMFIERALAPPIQWSCVLPKPWLVLEEARHEDLIRSSAREGEPAILHRLRTERRICFPEKRLVEYDCGKLQTLAALLVQLRLGAHRCLIFTQMSRMLDILEQFLSYHGYRYLRLDGTTRIEMRQAMMERFNADARIFVFILSTRSGGLGVNLTGADTVIFYDSDWNPTMDAQAQDRCHRIGQTRDVHIYRLISENTIEENILKKANQKRLLNEIAIEGGKFTTATLKQNTVQELFSEPTGLEQFVQEQNARETSRDVEPSQPVSDTSSKNVDVAIANSVPPAAKRNDLSAEAGSSTNGAPQISSQLEQALGELEECEDLQAAKLARAEASAELVEFDESVPWEQSATDVEGTEAGETPADGSPVVRAPEAEPPAATPAPEPAAVPASKTEQEFALILSKLNPIENLALKYLERTRQAEDDELSVNQINMDEMKKQWELNRLKAFTEEEELKAEVEEDEMFFTASRQLLSQVPRRSRGVRIRRGSRGIRGHSLPSRGAQSMSNSSCDTLPPSVFVFSSPVEGVIRGARARGRRPRSMGQSYMPPFSHAHPHPLLSSTPPHILDVSAPISEDGASVSMPSPAKTIPRRKTLPKLEPADEDIDNDDPEDLSFGERRGRGRGRSGRSRGGGGTARRASRAARINPRTSSVDMVSLDDLDDQNESSTERNSQERTNHIRGRMPTPRGKRAYPTSSDSNSVPAQLQFEIPSALPGIQPKRSAPPPPPIPIPLTSRFTSVRQPVQTSPQLISVRARMNLSLPAPPHVSELITKSRALAPGAPKSSINPPIRPSLRAGQPDFDSAAAAFRPRNPLAIRPLRIGGSSNPSHEYNISSGSHNGIAVRQVGPVITRPSAVTIVTYRPPASIGYIPTPTLQSAGSLSARSEGTLQLIPLHPQRFPRAPTPVIMRPRPQLAIQPIAMRVPASRPGGPRMT